MLVGKDTPALNDTNGGHFLVDNFSITEQDVKKSVVDGVPSIDFSERVYQLLEKEMSTYVVLKMLGQNPGITTKMLENGYFLAKFQSTADYDMILSQGPWILLEIEGMVGKVTKLDFNTNSKTRETKEKEEMIDKTFASSLMVGDGEYGPWMLVERRSRRSNFDKIKKENNSK
ncbi:hypothetical protein PVK06_033599 [Gossypium arboreum]|uniref:DUF4283 domain-containing protein n=1 Tax=Gossypium arboreum TaxID=29729 RepID=A0ABR0NBV5_GOSAR|nr:hypothetical protein PVK06_033599 [Gossypium arboreum]